MSPDLSSTRIMRVELESRVPPLSRETHDESLDLTEELDEYLKYQRASLYFVEQIKALAKTRRGYRVLVSWVGFPGEGTEESLLSGYQDVPDRVREFLNSTSESNPHSAAALELFLKADTFQNPKVK